MENNQYFVYILECIPKKGKRTYYTGYTKSLENRIKLHVEGKGARHTRGRKVKLIFYQTFEKRSEAMRREKYIKRLPRKKKSELVKSEINQKFC